MSRMMLGIESSCDDTAAAIVDPDGVVHASQVVSQTAIHEKWGGVYPEFASRAHVRAIVPAIDEAMTSAGVTQVDLEAIAVTRGPGLIGSLLVGLNAASGLSTAWDVPVIGVNHLRGHLRSADLEERRVTFPATILLVSGGHSIIAHMEDPSAIRVLGSTRDDSVGEAYDKVARMMGLGYPGGPVIDRLAKEGEAVIDLPRPMIREGLDFSFSGLKSAVARKLELDPDVNQANMAASFVACCMDVMLAKCRRALESVPAQSLVIVGGVAASPQLREGAKALTDEMGVNLCLPPLKWSTDNAAMIALAGWDYVALGERPDPVATPRLPIDRL